MFVLITFSVESLGSTVSAKRKAPISTQFKVEPFKTINSNNDFRVFKINDFQDWNL